MNKDQEFLGQIGEYQQRHKQVRRHVVLVTAYHVAVPSHYNFLTFC